MFGLIYSVLSYVIFVVSFSYFAWFSAGVLVPLNVDVGAAAEPSSALLIDLALIALFGLQHSVMARPTVKRWLTRAIPEHLERATYVLASSAVLVCLMWQWRPLPHVLWNVQNDAVAGSLWALNALGWLGVPLCSLMIDHLDLFGLKQAFHGFRRTSYERKGFVTPLLYRYMRHPMMVSVLIGFWSTPHMTAGHLLLSIGMTVYIIVGVHFEERTLVAELGPAYVRYQQSTPKFLPLNLTPPALEEGRASSAGPRGAA